MIVQLHRLIVYTALIWLHVQDVGWALPRPPLPRGLHPPGAGPQFAAQLLRPQPHPPSLDTGTVQGNN